MRFVFHRLVIDYRFFPVLVLCVCLLFAVVSCDDGSSSGDSSDGGEIDDDDESTPELQAEVGILEPEEGNPLAREIIVTTNLPCSLSAVATTPFDLGRSPSDPMVSEEGTTHRFWFYGLPEDADCDFSVFVAGDPAQVLVAGSFTIPPLDAATPRLYEVEDTGEAPRDVWIGTTIGFAAFADEGVEYYTALTIFDREGRIRFYHCNSMMQAEGVQQQLSSLQPLSNGELLVSNTIDLLAVKPDGEEYQYIDLQLSAPVFQPVHHLSYLYPDEQQALILFNMLGEGVACDNLTPTPYVVGDGVAKVDRSGIEAWRWSAFDHMEEIPQASTEPLACYAYHFGYGTTDWTHGNSVDYLASRNTFLVSLRNVMRIVNVDAQTGEILWQMGPGLDFTWLGDEDEEDKWFYMQHDAHWLSNGHLLMLDNGNCRGDNNCLNGEYSRALELAVDEEEMTVTNVWEYRVPFSHAIGSVERHPDGNTLITNGWNDFIVEATPDGRAVWSGSYLSNVIVTAVSYVPAMWDYNAKTAPPR